MKKTLLSFACMLSLLLSGYETYAFIKIFNIEIKYTRGKKEWNADQTGTECVGKGMCELVVSGGGGSARVGNVDGVLTIGIPSAYYATYPEDFAGNQYDINFDFEITPAQASGISYTGPLSFPAGTYNVQYDAEDDEYFVFLQ